MKDIQGEVFHDFEPPATTDGSYLGQKKHIDATKKHLQMKFEQELAQVNQRLKSGKIRVSIESRKGTIQLRATLPLKPNDSHPKGKDKKRRKSFCARSKGQKDMHNIDCSKTPEKKICKARKRWRC